MIDDPVIGRIGALGDHNIPDHGIARRPQPEIGNERQDQTMTLCNASGFGLDRAGIGIDVNLRHAQ
jgi:hypothetical protein